MTVGICWMKVKIYGMNQTWVPYRLYSTCISINECIYVLLTLMMTATFATPLSMLYHIPVNITWINCWILEIKPLLFFLYWRNNCTGTFTAPSHQELIVLCYCCVFSCIFMSFYKSYSVLNTHQCLWLLPPLVFATQTQISWHRVVFRWCCWAEQREEPGGRMPRTTSQNQTGWLDIEEDRRI